ncbi:hypothetical protein E3N88_31020 [Mikania micrantha]|uniref:Uncharacterized protein n=1 Tax=Mikania micrantha TaxID=192012 RepID=A0A5N6MP43_9ASTR|nr:hypothetical protein E3N88_31020 [Mikania micrantha]
MASKRKVAAEIKVSFKLKSCENQALKLHANIEVNGANERAKVDTEINSSSSQQGNMSVKAPSVGSVTSQEIPFSKLFEALSLKVSPDQMKTCLVLYESFKLLRSTLCQRPMFDQLKLCFWT